MSNLIITPEKYVWVRVNPHASHSILHQNAMHLYVLHNDWTSTLIESMDELMFAEENDMNVCIYGGRLDIDVPFKDAKKVRHDGKWYVSYNDIKIGTIVEHSKNN